MKSMQRLASVWGLFALPALILFAPLPNLRAAEPRDGVFIHLTQGKEDPHRALMGLHMAQIMSGDHDVLVYLDIKAVGLALKDAEDITCSPFPSSKEQLSALSKQGVILVVCPECLKAAGKTPADLAPGIRIADKKQFFSFTKGKILTLDY